MIERLEVTKKIAITESIGKPLGSVAISELRLTERTKVL